MEPDGLGQRQSPWESGATSDVPADATGEVAIHNRTAYFASEDGLLRLDLDGAPTWLSAWGSTGIDQSFYAPIVEYQGVLHYGLYGYGVIALTLRQGTPRTAADGNGNGARGALPSDAIFSVRSPTSVEAQNSPSAPNLAPSCGTEAALHRSRWTQLGRTARQHLEFMDLGSYLYAATNLGVCRWQLDASGGLDIDGCLTVYDGMPNWATYSLGHNSTHVFGGTLSGVGVIARSSFTVVDTWETKPLTTRLSPWSAMWPTSAWTASAWHDGTWPTEHGRTCGPQRRAGHQRHHRAGGWRTSQHPLGGWRRRVPTH